MYILGIMEIYVTHLPSFWERNRNVNRAVMRQPVRDFHIAEAVVLYHEHSPRSNGKRHNR